MPDPPVHHNPPPFTTEDIRISPSGPYVPGAGGAGIVQFGADAVVEPFTMVVTGSSSDPINRTTGTPHPLHVTFPSWVSGDVLWVVWHASGVWIPTNATEAVLRIVLTVDLGAGPQMINNAQVLQNPNFVVIGEEDISTGFSVAGTAAIRLIDPANPPIVQLFYSMQSDNPDTSAQIAGILPEEGAGSCWLTCVELADSICFQLPPEVVLSPLT